ncbi:MAG: DNA double-strand break repair nuclease NurA [Vicinamibacterales bacterium]
MHFDIHIRHSMKERLADVASRMAAWDRKATPTGDVHDRLVKAIQPFRHTTGGIDVLVGGVDGSGEFPIVAYADSFVYATIAAATAYQADAVHGLREADLGLAPLVEFTWLTTSEEQRRRSLLESFERLVGRSIDDVLAGSDYAEINRAGRAQAVALKEGLIVPPAHDAGNLGIQLRTTAELAAALRLIEVAPKGSLVLTDGTMSLPFVHRERQSLFFEHLRRFCCVRARERGVVFAALSKSHGLPSGIRLEDAARERLGGADAEHWYIRVPDAAHDGWSMFPEDGPRVPPPGAVTYLVRFHRSTPIMRIDLDARLSKGAPADPAEEDRLFEVLDYAGHDQRCFGYPYPVKAAHDRTSLSQHEKVALKKQVIDAALRAGLKRSLFRDASQATGHA